MHAGQHRLFVLCKIYSIAVLLFWRRDNAELLILHVQYWQTTIDAGINEKLLIQTRQRTTLILSMKSRALNRSCLSFRFLYFYCYLVSCLLGLLRFFLRVEARGCHLSIR